MAAAEKKTQRATAKSHFTRYINKLNNLLDKNVTQAELVTPLFDKVNKCYETLEDAHNEFIAVANINIEEDPDGTAYMVKVDDTHDAAVIRYSEFLRNAAKQEQIDMREAKREEEKRIREERKTMEAEKKVTEELRLKEERAERFTTQKAQLSASIAAFNRMTVSVRDNLKNVSGVDKRREWEKVESEFTSLKSNLNHLMGIDPSLDAADVNDMFQKEAEKIFVDMQKDVLLALKDVPLTSGGATISTSSNSTIRKESVMLPSFEGDENKSPFLKFPTWKKQWEVMITDYDQNYRDVMLCRHLDDAALARIVGYETDYAESFKRLEQYYGDPLKIIQCIQRKVSSASEVKEGDYEGLINYSNILEDNFNRLTAMGEGYQKEMSNSSAMASILRKFPRVVGEQWHDHLIQQGSSEKLNPFPVLINWLKSRRQTWESMAAVDKEIWLESESSFYGQDRGAKKKQCFKCGADDHVLRWCPENNDNDTRDNLGDNRDNRGPKPPRRKPLVKKYWCALHKEEGSRRCFSESCQELRRVDATKRIQLLLENGDCSHCCGDHSNTDCQKKERVCGGNKDDRGCRKSHQVHELFCLEARVFSIQHTYISESSKKEGVLLLIMQVRMIRKQCKGSVFWDYGSTSNFVRDKFAKSCGFKGKMENLSVTTLGGVVSEHVSVMTYKCSMVDVDGQVEYFEAYGMESITGTVTGIGFAKIKKLFPNLSEQNIKMLQRSSDVDILIGAGHVSWHPDRAEKARGGGDFWIFRGRFGSCLGGRHPKINETTRKSDNLFATVQRNFHISSETVASHELEFCPRQTENYFLQFSKKERVEKPSAVGCKPTQSNNVDHDTSAFPDVSEWANPLVLSSESEPMQVVDIETKSTVTSHVPTAPFLTDSEEHSTPSLIVSTHEPNHCNNLPDTQHHSDPSNTVSYAEKVQSDLCYAMKVSALTDEDLFFKSEAIGTVVQPECGGCKCGKCPIPGMKYSFREQQGYDKIQSNLVYNEGEKRWYVELPWATARCALPRNDAAALKLLLSFERQLSKKPELSEAYCEQIRLMVERGVAMELTKEQLESWNGDYYYLPLLGVMKNNQLRVVFDAARRQCGHPSMNECLMKGPDRFMNDLGSVLLGFRNGRVAAVADISKFHNQVYLFEQDYHMQRFLWRDMKTNEAPKHMAVVVNNFGVTSANCIATSALHKSADCFSEIYPYESQYIKEQTYVDDELVAASTMEDLATIMSRLDEIKDHASMPNKGWTVSGDQNKSNVSIGDDASGKVLGMLYHPSTDSFHFQVTLKLKTATGEIIVTSPDELKQNGDNLILTRRILLANVARIFDPLGLLTALLLESKILMRESWCGENIGWDDPLSPDLQRRWLDFLFSLLGLGKVTFARSLWPQEEVEGLPTLVIFSDGSVQAFGAVAYIHWKLASGKYWSRLIMAKSKIAPKNMVSVPRMELNGAVIGNRMKNFILNETNLKFANVYHLVDSSTVLGYVQKECGVFHPYEGVRVAEIQASNTFLDGLLVGFAWVSTHDNPADWCTKPHSVEDIQGPFWTEGAEFLKHDVSKWPLKFSYKKDNFEGQLPVPRSVKCLFVQTHHNDFLGRLVNRSSSWPKCVRVLAWIRRFTDIHYFRLLHPQPLNAAELQRARTHLIKFAQRELVAELHHAADTGKGKYRKLAPVKDEAGIWRVGSRMRVVPFTIDAQLPALLPPKHRVTLLIMQHAHKHSHRAQDGTVARFRAIGFWTVRCGHLAKNVYDKCVTCRKLNHKTLHQKMGDFPEDRLKDPVAWGYCQMDLVGPVLCRGDVNPRTSKKTWAMVVEDVNSGAVHLDVVQDYSAQGVIQSLRRFGALRGWPGVISSDPGSQLESASGKLEEWWSAIGDSLCNFAGSKNFEWKISPADSPWRQGKAERRIAIVKRLVTIAIGESRVTPIEFQTILMEIANICNERPIGSAEPRADGSYALITPNQLLLGRSTNILPDDTEMVERLPLKVSAQYRLVHQITTSFWK